jgi:hypothetical protein
MEQGPLFKAKKSKTNHHILYRIDLYFEAALTERFSPKLAESGFMGVEYHSSSLGVTYTRKAEISPKNKWWYCLSSIGKTHFGILLSFRLPLPA